MNKRSSRILLFFVLCIPLIMWGSESSEFNEELPLHEKPSQAPEKIEVKPTTRDNDIGKRLEGILQTTKWFINPKVHVENGVVFLTGETKNYRFKDWAGDLAHNTQNVAAVVNQIVVPDSSLWDWRFIVQEFLTQGKKVVRGFPSILFAFAILLLFWIIARFTYKLVPLIFRNKINPSLLHEVIARAISFFVFMVGVYFVFEMAELTKMALTIISGTGILGIILGIAFRDLAENFLASILLSLQNPFHTHDLIDLVNPTTGYTITGHVERLTMRVTMLLSSDGNHLQIPNATVYKSNIINHSSNPHHRETFLVSIGPNCSISKAVDSALKILEENTAILKNPEPLVLVEELEKEGVKLKVCYWIDIKKSNPHKIKSAMMRLVKQIFQAEGYNDQLNLKTAPHLEDMAVHHHEKQTTKSEKKTREDCQTEKIAGFSSESRLPEDGKNLLGKNN